jgi:molybdopterin/thiamine biosynthesis adenylyltransferase
MFEPGVYDSYTDVDIINPDALRKAAIGQQGAGGLGVHYAIALARMGFGQIEVCDGDRVELKNLPIQFFYPSQIGQNKALSLSENLKKECTGKTTIIGYPMYFSDALKAYPGAFSKVNVILSLVDNHRARYEAAEFALKHKIPMITAGISDNMKVASVFVQLPGEACFNCFQGTYKNKDKTERLMCRHLAVLYPHTAIVAVAVFATTEIIMGRKLPWNYFYLSFTGESINGTVERRPDCELCGGGK